MEEDLALAAAKLHLKEHPVAVQLHKYRMEGLKEELQRLKRSLEKGDEYVLKSKGPRWLPRLFWRRDRLALRPADSTAIGRRMAELQEVMQTLGSDVLHGILVPLTLADEGVINAYYFKTRRHLAAALPQTGDPLEHQAREEAITFSANHYLHAKRLELMLRKRVPDANGQSVPALTEREAHAVDWRIARELWAEYVDAFVLTEDELGKSAAPRKAA